ncbi:MAG: hypothetical protein WCT44_03430 [Candidatus Paceibacterota bacterium]
MGEKLSSVNTSEKQSPTHFQQLLKMLRLPETATEVDIKDRLEQEEFNEFIGKVELRKILPAEQPIHEGNNSLNVWREMYFRRFDKFLGYNKNILGKMSARFLNEKTKKEYKGTKEWLENVISNFRAIRDLCKIQLPSPSEEELVRILDNWPTHK